MRRFKRNQVEAAIITTLSNANSGAEKDARSRMKRVLDADRALSEDRPRGNFAFYTGEAPGSGADYWFYEYEAYALFLAILLLRMGWPQRFAVQIMATARSDLEVEFRRIRSVARDVAADEDGEQADDQDEAFLAIVASGQDADGLSINGSRMVKVCRGEEKLMAFRRRWAVAGLGSFTAFEITATATALMRHLEGTTPRSRGRQPH